ncbi:MAG TPA: AraC family transcriptional regulator [Halieaceae bacterium]|nr:AraC family transcriptional regulator [Halieaceae bacterium]|tara:strand:+ start:4230 stop:5267 length:1038 start_codon:yes stop_codon:yes gene_type:complete
MSEHLPSRFVRTLLRLVEEHGHDPAAVLAAAELDFNPLQEGAPGYREQVSAMEYSRVYQQALRLLQDSTFGVVRSGFTGPGAFRMMCFCIVSCRDLGGAILRAAEFYRTFFDEQSQLYANFSEDTARVGYLHDGPLAWPTVGAADVYGLSLWHRFFGWLCGRPLPLQRVDFRASAPPNPEKYADLFQCPLTFGQPRDLLYFDASCLAWPVVHNEHSLQDFLRTAPYQLLLMDDRESHGRVAAQVSAMLGHDFSQGVPAFETISQALEMSPPTLRRKLRREGTTFQALKDAARCEAARLALDRPDGSIEDVALRLGFTDPSAFHRAFRKWTGQTPGQYRSARRRSR